VYTSGLSDVVKMNVTSHLNNEDESNRPGKSSEFFCGGTWQVTGEVMDRPR